MKINLQINKMMIKMNKQRYFDVSFWYSRASWVELSLIGHFTYRYIGRKYHDLSIYIDLFIIFLINVKNATFILIYE